jgi:multidrug efflux pump
MSLSSVSIKRPVLSIVMSLILIIFGIVSFSNLEVREYPSVDPPIISVNTDYSGANADVIETQITEPLEMAVNGIEGIKTLTSVSRDGSSRLTIEFELSRNLEDAANDVRDRVSAAQRNLPPDADPPVVRKADADATPVIFTFVRSSTRNILEVSDYASSVISERVQTITGVAGVNVWGEKRYAMRLWLDPARLAAYKLTPLDVQAALMRENVELPAGRIEGSETELSIRTLGRLSDPGEFNNLVIREENGSVVKMHDVGYAVIDAENIRSGVRRGGIPGVAVSIQALPGANLIDISNQFRARFEEIKKDLPDDIEYEITFDASEYVRSTVNEVQNTIFIAFLLVVLIIFLFLRDWRSTIIPVISIPISIIATFFVLYMVGFSINVLTLVGIILAIGLVVDDSIVVLENIYSKIEKGMSPFQAAFKGSKEIYFAVISTTLSLVAVFLPILFLEGLVGRLFREFGVTISAAVLFSSFVALSLTVMLSSRILKKHDKSNKFYNLTEPFFRKLTDMYVYLLAGFLKVRWAAFIVVLICGGIIFYIGSSLQSELAPLEDRSNLRVTMTAPEGSSYEYTLRYALELTDLLIDSVPEVIDPLTIVNNPTSGFMNLFLVKPEDRDRTQNEIHQDISRKLNSITGVRGATIQPPTIGSRFARQPVNYVIQAPNYDRLVEVIPRFLEEAEKSNILEQADSDLRVNSPEIILTIDRNKANILGVNTMDISRTLQSALGGQRFGYFIKNGKQYQVIGQLDRESRNAPYDLRYIFVRNNKGDLIQLDNVVKVEEGVTSVSRNRYNRYISSTISAGLAHGYTIGDGIYEMDMIADIVLDEDMSTALTGQSKDYAESSSSLLFVFIFAIIIVFLVLAAQFESFIDPVIIMMTVPLSMTGALISLWIFGQTLNVFSQIGIIMLVGLVTKNAILIVEFSNQRKRAGLSKLEAVKDGAASRFRPILMTTLSTVLGILPIAVGFGAASRSSLGVAVVGGLLFATFLTLFVVPAVYSYFSREYDPVMEEELVLSERDLVGVPD